MNHRGLSEDERRLLTHLTLWGSDGYPIRKLGRRGWTLEHAALKKDPRVFKTKREAVVAFEAFYEVLRRAHAECHLAHPDDPYHCESP